MLEEAVAAEPHPATSAGYAGTAAPVTEEAESPERAWCGDFFAPEDGDDEEPSLADLLGAIDAKETEVLDVDDAESVELAAPTSGVTAGGPAEQQRGRDEFYTPAAPPVSLGPDVPAQPLAERAQRPASPPRVVAEPPGPAPPLQTEAPLLTPATPEEVAATAEAPAAEAPASPILLEGKPPQDFQPVESDDVVNYLAKLQLVLPVPTVAELRAARPLRRGPDEIWASQFILQTARRKVDSWMASQDGQREFHPHLENASWHTLDDGSNVVYQSNGIARVTRMVVNRPARCDKTGAPGIYQETQMLVARRKEGKCRAGLKGARSMDTAQKVKENLFYTFTSCWLYLACTSNVGELGEEDTGERVFIRRSVKEFRQHSTHEFPIAKQLCQLMDNENRVMSRKFLYDPGDVNSQALVAYELASIRAWQTYEFDGKPPPDDAARMLIDAARSGRTAELERLVLQKRFDINCTLTEFGLFGTGQVSCFTSSPLAYGIEGTALIEAIRIGWESVVECIVGFADQGLANLDIVCSEWNPEGAGGPGLRQRYTALDIARLYQRKSIEGILLRAGAKPSQAVPCKMRENPFVARAKQENGEYTYESQDRESDERRYDDFSFAEFDGLKVDDEMKGICSELEKEIKAAGHSQKEKLYKKLALRWHPDKHPDDKKSLATRIFQWIQRHKDGDSWETRAWSA